MGKRGTYKYICDVCQAVNWLSHRERESRFKPHCVECGSTWLEPSSGSRGPEKLSKAVSAAKDQIDLQNKKMGKNKGF